MKNLMSRLSRQSGLSLLEAALVLAVLGLIISGVWALSSGAFGSNKKNRLAEQVISVVETSRAYLRNTDLGTAILDTESAWQLGLLPTDIRRGGEYRTPYGGAFTFGASNTQINIILDGLPSDACVDLLYARLGGGANAASNMGLRGYSATGAVPVSTNYSFNTVTTACGNSTSLLLVFTPR